MNSDQLEFKSGGGCSSLGGVPFFLFGLGGMIMVSLYPSKSSGMETVVGFIITFLFFLIGAGVIFGRAGITIDRRRKIVQSWWGLLFPMYSSQYKTEGINYVEITKEVRGGKHKKTVFPVKIPISSNPIEIEDPEDHLKARGIAERVAKFLNMGIKDNSAGKEVIREAGTLDESFREKLIKAGNHDFPIELQSPRIRYHKKGSTGGFELPQVGMTIALKAVLIASGAIAGVFGVFFFVALIFPIILGSASLKTLPFMLLIFIGFLSIPSWLAISALKASSIHERILVSPREISIERSDRTGKTILAMKSDKLEELEILPQGNRLTNSVVFLIGGSVISAISDEKEFSFGYGLTKAELEWLFTSIKFHLALDEELV